MNSQSPSQSETSSQRRTAGLAAGEILQSRYRIIREMGRGGMGAVYEAVDDRLRVSVALKETFAVDTRLRRQFEQEARLLAHLNHPALPRVSDYFTEGERTVLVMQLISGVDLAEILNKQGGPFPSQQVIAWADQLLDALVYLHTRERQIIHRDIKPHNLKLTANGQIVLLDFGLAKAHAADISTTNSSSIFGYTRRYSPLEQMQDEGTTAQSDIYALGATLYHLLTGAKPADALARATALASGAVDPLVSPHEVNGRIPVELSELLMCAMALRASDRFATAADFREALRNVGRTKSEPEARLTAASMAAREKSSQPDPFDAYSILRPEQVLFRSTQINQRRVGTLIVLAVLIAGITGIYYADRLADISRGQFAASSGLLQRRSPIASGSSVERAPAVNAGVRVSEAANVAVSRKPRADASPSIQINKPKRPANKSLKAPPVVLPSW